MIRCDVTEEGGCVRCLNRSEVEEEGDDEEDDGGCW